MDKIITQQQIEQITNELFKLNLPVQSFHAIQDMLNKLPPVEDKKQAK